MPAAKSEPTPMTKKNQRKALGMPEAVIQHLSSETL
jgi:hypothetical protein